MDRSAGPDLAVLPPSRRRQKALSSDMADVTQVAELLHGEESAVYADVGYTGVGKREEHENRDVIWQIAARRGRYSRLNKRSVLYKAKRKIEYCKAHIRAKVEHPFRVIKRQFWLRESTLSWAGEIHGPVDHAICPVEPVDGSKTTDGFG